MTVLLLHRQCIRVARSIVKLRAVRIDRICTVPVVSLLKKMGRKILFITTDQQRYDRLRAIPQTASCCDYAPFLGWTPFTGT
jgi:hypothetical protein